LNCGHIREKQPRVEEIGMSAHNKESRKHTNTCMTARDANAMFLKKMSSNRPALGSYCSKGTMTEEV
jgi:hypothetical protein